LQSEPFLSSLLRQILKTAAFSSQTMKSLYYVRSTLVSAAALVAVSATAAPLFSLGDNTALFINSEAGVEYNSNILRTESNEDSETTFIVRPGIEITHGGEGAAMTTFTAGWEVRRYDTYSEFNGEYARLNLNTSYDSGVTLFSGVASFNEYSGTSGVLEPGVGSETLTIPVLNERAESRLGGNVKYRLSDRLALGAGGEYWGRTYQNGPQGRTLVNLDRYEVPLRVFYNIAPRLDVVAGYRYREVQIGDSPVGQPKPSDYDDHYFFVGLDGEIFNPLWSASLDLGFQERNYSDGTQSVDSFTANGRITYQADANRSYYLLLTRDYSVSPVGASSYVQNQATVGANYRLNEMWSLMAAANYAVTDYDGSDREEDLFYVLGGISYSPNEYVSINARVRLTTIDGEGTGATNFDNEFISLSASIRY